MQSEARAKLKSINFNHSRHQIDFKRCHHNYAQNYNYSIFNFFLFGRLQPAKSYN